MMFDAVPNRGLKLWAVFGGFCREAGIGEHAFYDVSSTIGKAAAFGQLRVERCAGDLLFGGHSGVNDGGAGDWRRRRDCAGRLAASGKELNGLLAGAAHWAAFC